MDNKFANEITQKRLQRFKSNLINNMNNIENRTTKGYFLTNYKTIEVERLNEVSMKLFFVRMLDTIKRVQL